MDVQNQQQQSGTAPTINTASGSSAGQNDAQRIDNEGDVVFYMEEPKAGTPNRARRDNR